MILLNLETEHKHNHKYMDLNSSWQRNMLNEENTYETVNIIFWVCFIIKAIKE